MRRGWKRDSSLAVGRDLPSELGSTAFLGLPLEQDDLPLCYRIPRSEALCNTLNMLALLNESWRRGEFGTLGRKNWAGNLPNGEL